MAVGFTYCQVLKLRRQN